MNLLVPPGRAGARVHAAHAVAGGSELIASVAFTTRRRGQRGDATSIASIPSTIVWWKPRSAKGRDQGIKSRAKTFSGNSFKKLRELYRKL